MLPLEKLIGQFGNTYEVNKEWLSIFRDLKHFDFTSSQVILQF